jgi:alkanesulfonate monooxygenase SsuD/methylene tetrahydromethanopterin reductase-like flavin-dependent oxidoreductase (luciferase family)
MLRHPALTAMEAATLDETTGGRLTLGLGVSHRETMRGMYGLSLDRPIGRMREYLGIVRQVLETGASDFTGEHYEAHFGFIRYRAREGIRIVVAALGEQMLRLAGELADGVVLWMCSPAYIRETVRPTLEKALAERGRSLDDFDIVANVPVALTEHLDEARNAVRKRIMPYAQLPFYRRVIRAGGHEEELDAFDEAIAEGTTPEALRALSDALVEDYAGIGDAASIRAKLDEYREAGATLPSIGPVRHDGAPDVRETLEALAP